MNNVVEVTISDIKIGDRFRKDMGDLAAFANMVAETLLQPIGITPDHELIFGERRLRVYRDVLGRETIPARIIDVKSPLLAQITENVCRKDFTPSELVAIVQAWRTFSHGGDRRSKQNRKCNIETLATEEAAKRVGLSKDTFTRAQKVVEHGVPELVEAMDQGKLSIFAASELAEAGPEEQRDSLGKMPNESRWTARGIQKHLRRQRMATRREADTQRTVITPDAGDAVRIYHCPFQGLETLAGIEPDSVNLILTDIPYGRDFVPEISNLAEMASRILVDGGLFVMYSGQSYLSEVMRRLDEHLTYRWTIASVWDGDANLVYQPNVISQWKPIVVYTKGEWRDRIRWPDVSRVIRKEKDLHEWQQPLSEVESLVRYFSNAGDLVVDPCGGSFTTAIACHRLGRRFIGCDSDRSAVVVGQQRLAEERKEVACLPLVSPEPLAINSVTQEGQQATAPAFPC